MYIHFIALLTTKTRSERTIVKSFHRGYFSQSSSSHYGNAFLQSLRQDQIF